MKTIKQIADELGVSKTAVRKKIENLGLRSSLRKNGNQFAIDEWQETLIKQGFFEKTQTENANQTQTENHINDAVSEAVMELLRQELEQKNEQLKEKDRQIAQLQKLIDQEQQLHMVTERKFQLLEQQQEQEKSDIVEDKKWWQFWK